MHFHFDWSINVGTICSLAFLIASIVNYGRKVTHYLGNLNKKVEIMWDQFVIEHPDMNFSR